MRCDKIIKYHKKAPKDQAIVLCVIEQGCFVIAASMLKTRGLITQPTMLLFCYLELAIGRGRYKEYAKINLTL
jgi:hypothetical protein